MPLSTEMSLSHYQSFAFSVICRMQRSRLRISGRCRGCWRSWRALPCSEDDLWPHASQVLEPLFTGLCVILSWLVKTTVRTLLGADLLFSLKLFPLSSSVSWIRALRGPSPNRARMAVNTSHQSSWTTMHSSLNEASSLTHSRVSQCPGPQTFCPFCMNARYLEK